MAFNIAPFIVYNLTRPKNRKEEENMEVMKCPQCGRELTYIDEIPNIYDDVVKIETEYFCFECDESFFTERTGKIMWD